ncbi:putative signal transducing protein [Polaribacter sp.]|uniref:putative signal transducing protein n=1 Tax=Polaribacter sp. TaxID=1920175 RepID=UPI003F6B0D5F
METDYIKLFTDTTIIINGLKIELEAEGIPYLVKDRFESARLGGFGEQQGSVEIHVLQKDVANAEKVLSAYKSQINA